ncbi:MAG: hypothetical protein BIP78_0991 [Candidatus Bipolaricaulis sibiricus]|uniref:Uncharacterized protein n=1 Tax=Bipolaricaulis sibiricus TaxID=2501609 RepID=A0A410FUK4_BIPS1|nr:MAG: hypothetical protein BIP78_0991 [Candidatus Bipolaricaulis sibiricus]
MADAGTCTGAASQTAAQRAGQALAAHATNVIPTNAPSLDS